MPPMNRCYLRATQGLLILAILVMVVGFLLAQVRAQGMPPTQDGVNYFFYSELIEMKRRVGEIEQMYKYGMGVLLANLIAHLFQIRALKVRSESKKED